MRKSVIGLVSLITPAILGAAVTSGCDKAKDAAGAAGGAFEELCGPCGTVATGDVGISGNAKIDGFFSAVASLDSAVVTISSDFETNINLLIAAFCTQDMDGVFTCGGTELAANASLQAKVDALTADIEAEVSANAMGSLTVNYVGPKCEASASVAVQAQAQCEAKAECDVQVDPGNVSVQCSGKCEGSCSAGCSGGFKCDVSASGTCSGSCEGSCELTAAAACDGTCRGTCSGNCSAYDGMGQCAGACDGMCMGSCEFKAAAECSGHCSGKCVVEAEADCEGRPVTCSGSCTGQCSGSCTGEATPPSASANCEASADCQAQAKAQASAKIECSPPSLDIGFQFQASVDADARAAFGAKIAQLKVSGVAILQGFANMTALINGKVDGKVVFDPAPLEQITTSIEGLVSAGADGDLFVGIPAGRITCALGAFADSATTLGSMTSRTSAIISAQTSFAGSLTGGFGS